MAAGFIFILAYDAFVGLQFSTDSSGKALAAGETQFGLGIGGLVLWGNVFFLGGYTFGCHSFRHLIGGGINLLSKTPVASKCYECVGCLNSRHMLFAWCSLFWVGFHGCVCVDVRQRHLDGLPDFLRIFKWEIFKHTNMTCW